LKDEIKKNQLEKKKLESIKVNLLNMRLGSWDEDKLIGKKLKKHYEASLPTDLMLKSIKKTKSIRSIYNPTKQI